MSPKLEINNSVLLHLILWVGLLPWLLRRKASTYTAGDLGLIPGSGRSPAEGNGNPLQYSCLENPMDTIHRFTELDMNERLHFKEEETM